MSQNQSRLGLTGLAAAAEVLAADCRFNLWFLNDVKEQKSVATQTKEQKDIRDDWLMNLLENHEANDERCRSAMAAFVSGGSEERLCGELAEVAAFLNERPSPP